MTIDHRGPWKINESHGVAWIGYGPDDPVTGNSQQCLAYNITGGACHPRTLLLAAAPELYEALEMLCNGLEWNIENRPDVMNESDSEALATARAALAKARGEATRG